MTTHEIEEATMETHDVVLVCQSWRGDAKTDAINEPGSILNVQHILIDGVDVFCDDFAISDKLMCLTLVKPSPQTWERFSDTRTHLLGSSAESLELAMRTLEIRYS